MVSSPKATLEDLGKAMGRAKSNVSARLNRLAGERLVEQAGSKWLVTPKGRRLAETFKPDQRAKIPFWPPEQAASCSTAILDVLLLPEQETEARTERLETPRFLRVLPYQDKI